MSTMQPMPSRSAFSPDRRLARKGSFFTEARHQGAGTLEDGEADASSSEPAQEWRIRSSRTYGGVLAVCLNVDVEPPDCPFPRALQTGAGRLLCGIDPYESTQDSRKVVARGHRARSFSHLVASRGRPLCRKRMLLLTRCSLIMYLLLDIRPVTAL